jgi:potassium/hydrogen antiporter
MDLGGFPITEVFIVVAVLLLISVLASKISDRFGIPALLFFLLAGMLAGSEGPGGIYFDNFALAQAVGVIALVFILFSGGLDTQWARVRPVLWQGGLLGTAGVLIGAVVAGLFAHFVLGLPVLVGLLLASICASTDAAAVFAAVRSGGFRLRGALAPLLELESGGNDPMAIFLTIGCIQLITEPATSPLDLVSRFFVQMSLGLLIGATLGRATALFLNRLRLGYDGLYPVITVAMVLLVYGATEALGGNGFLAAYVAGIMLGNQHFIHKRSLMQFHDGLAWLMQIVMFLALGLLVFPGELLPNMWIGLLFTAFVMFVARPLAVFLCLWPSKQQDRRDKLFISWAGLRGAAPIVLATYPALAGVNGAREIFHVVFFVVLVSVLAQGTTLTRVARRLGVLAPPVPPAEPAPVAPPPAAPPLLTEELRELDIQSGSSAAHRSIVELGLPPAFLIVLIRRDGESLIPNGGTQILPGDRLLVLADEDEFSRVAARLTPPV